jgi:asparagine synthase (glutamine-hydrolysing)
MWASWADQIQQVVGQSRVILTGDGGDNILCASRHYVHHLFKGLQLGRLARELGHCLLIHRRLPQIGLRSTLRRVRQGEDSIFPTWLNPSLVDRLELRSRWEYFTHGYAQPQVLRREIYQSLAHPMLQDYFEKKYAPAATGTAVAFYHPYYDVRLINFALALPPLPWCVSKILLREAARGVLPEEIRSRAKTPLRGNPVMEVLKKPAARWVDHFIPTPELARYVDRAAVPPLAGETNLAKMWLNLRPLNFNSWLSHFRPRNWGEQAL